MVVCPECGRTLVAGSLRCRFCGSDARQARPPNLDPNSPSSDAASRHIAVVAGLYRRLSIIAPEALRWLRSPAETRGPAPSIRGPHRDEATRIVVELLRARGAA